MSGFSRTVMDGTALEVLIRLGGMMSRAHRFLPAGLLAAGLLTTMPSAASAQRYPRDYQRAEQRAYDNGYREGMARGEQDARARRDFSFVRYEEYRRADEGYRVGDGDLRDYRETFRQGFEAGYTDSYDRTMREERAVPLGRQPIYRSPYPVSPRSSVLSPAARIGYQDGLEVGRKDARDGESYDPVRSDRYRSANHEYDRKYGTRDEFKREYRDGFEQGYEQGYRAAEP
jgi:hypothetical protein